MDLADRVARRRSARHGRGPIVDRTVLSPVVHRPEPVGRGPVLEQLLDVFDGVFDGTVPSNCAVIGPHGAGKSAVITGLFAAMNDVLGQPSRTIGTTTRAGSRGPTTWFVAVDLRQVRSEFAFYRALLSATSQSTLPDSGIGVDVLRDRLGEKLHRPDRRAVIAVDHHDEPDALAYDRICELLDPVSDSVSIVPVGRRLPDRWDEDDPIVDVPAYRRHGMIDIVTERASAGLAAGTFDHDAVRELVRWADGNAHDALSGLYGAAVLATEAGADRVDAEHLEAAMADVPDGGDHVARALALSETRQQVLHALIALDTADRPIKAIAAAVAERTDLTASTVKRFLYELADFGVVDRVPLQTSGSGRQPSTIVLRFPTIVFRTLSPVDAGE